MKIIFFENIDQDERRKILNSELSVGAELARHNSFLLPIVEYFVENSSYFLIMEYCTNGDLKKLLDKNKEEKIKMPRNVYLMKFVYFLNLIGTYKTNNSCCKWFENSS
jgi:serine/threonine protein kinase